MSTNTAIGNRSRPGHIVDLTKSDGEEAVQDVVPFGGIDIDTKASLKTTWHARSHRADASTKPDAVTEQALKGWDPRKQRASSSSGLPADSNGRSYPGPPIARPGSLGPSYSRPSIAPGPSNITSTLPQAHIGHQNVPRNHVHARQPLVPSSENSRHQSATTARHINLPRLYAKPAINGGHLRPLSAAHHGIPIAPRRNASEKVSQLSTPTAPPPPNQPVAQRIPKEPPPPNQLASTHPRRNEHNGPISQASSSRFSNAFQSYGIVSPQVSYAQASLPHPNSQQKLGTTQSRPEAWFGKLNIAADRKANGQFARATHKTQAESSYASNELGSATKLDANGRAYHEVTTTQSDLKDSHSKIEEGPNSVANGRSHHSIITTRPEAEGLVSKFASSTKRNVNGQPKINGTSAIFNAASTSTGLPVIERDASKGAEAVNPPPTTASFADGYKTYVPSNWDPTLPDEIVQVLQAMRRIVLPSGAPNRSGLKKWADETLPGTNYLVGHGNLGTTSPLWEYTLKQLGFSREAWRYLNRSDKPLRFPGLGSGAKGASRPSMPQQSVMNDEAANPWIAPVFQGGLNNSVQSQDPTAQIQVPSHTTPQVVNLEIAMSSTVGTKQGGSIAEATYTPERDMDAVTSRLLAAVQTFVAGRDVRNTPWDASEDDLLIHLKEVVGLPWHKIGSYFSYRVKNWSGCQVRYSSKLSRRNQPPTPRREPSSRDSHDRQSSDSQSEKEATALSTAQPRKSSRLRQTDASARNYRPLEYFRKAFHGVEPEQGDSDEELATTRSMRVVRRDINNVTVPDVMALSSTTGTSFVKPANSSISTLRAALETDRYHAALSGDIPRIAREPMPTPRGAPLPQHLRRSRLVKRRSISIDRPYLSANERRYLSDSTQLDIWEPAEANKWQDAPLHVDFSSEEMRVLEDCVYHACAELPMTPIENTKATTMHHLAALLMAGSRSSHVDPATLFRRLSWQAIHTGLLNRTRQSIECFLHDQYARLQDVQSADAAGRTLRLDSRTKQSSVHRSLRLREHATSAFSRSSRCSREAVYNTLGPLLSFTGMSSDVNSVAWSPDARTFAVGSATLTDSHSMQYNRPRNLLLGDTESRILRDLPHHATKRLLTEQGANSTTAMYASQDPVLYQSISAVAFSKNGSAMYSAGYDNTLRVYDIRSGVKDAYLKYAFTHRAPIDLLAVSERGIFATGCARSKDAIRVFRDELDVEDASSLPAAKYFSPRARDHPDQKIQPTSLKWGHNLHAQSNYLLCGFSAQGDEFGQGEVCVWDIQASQPVVANLGSRSIFDVAWSPSTFGRFAVARTPGEHVNRGIRSVVQLFDSRALGNGLQVNTQRTTELECPALDINDVIFNPTDDYLISVGCTDSAIYMWDLRKPDEILHRLAHGEPLLEIDEHRALEEVDTGIRYLSWNATHRGLISGSSDGIVAKWNPYRAPEDAFESTIAQLKSGVMAGAFDADFSSLLLGEVNGTVSVLTVGRNADDDHFEDFDLQANPEDVQDVHRSLGIQPAAPEDESGIAASRELLRSGAMKIRPFGDFPRHQAVQGDLYQGPYDQGLDATKLRQGAQERQDNIRSSTNQCQIEHEIPRMTEEERGHNKASKLRIPETFRYLPVRERTKHIEKYMSCFRCDQPLRHGSVNSWNADIVRCSRCKIAWRVDLLGYTLLEADDGCHAYMSSAESTDAKAQVQLGPISLEDIFADMEEANEIDVPTGGSQTFEEYVHSFWQDRPSSPI